MKFSLCMIVKNEAAVLRKCLDSIKDLMDEIIIVDTGSTDDTKKIALEYTSQVYDYEWKNDFADARNFAFSKATGDYIYSADADEVIDDANRMKFKALKQVIMPEVEIVQMIYVTEQINHPTENFAKDLRPKLFKRLRNFTWIEPIHETVNTNPVVFDSDIEIIHRPQGSHSARDLSTFERLIAQNEGMSDRLLTMYLRELYKAGTEKNFESARVFLEKSLEEARKKEKTLLVRQTIAVLLKTYRQQNDAVSMLKLALSEEVNAPSAEVCLEIGYFFMKQEDYEEAIRWFNQAAYGCESEIDIASSGTSPLQALSLCYRKLVKSPKLKALPNDEYEVEKIRLTEKAADCEQMAREWKPREYGF